jgi:hypothetical protein
MGDTLAHLESRADVSKLFRNAHQALAPGGRLPRDLSTELTGLDASCRSVPTMIASWSACWITSRTAS